MPNRIVLLLLLLIMTVPLMTVPRALADGTGADVTRSDVTDALPPEEIREDFAVLYETLQAAHYDLFVNRPKPAYDALYQQMRATFSQPMTVAEIQQAFQQFVAFGNVAHAKINPPVGAWERFRAEGGKAFPLYLRVVDGRVYIDDTQGVAGVRQGQEVLAVDGRPIFEWLAKLRSHLSADSDHLAYTMMENQLPLLVWQSHGAPEEFQLTVASDAGGTTEVTVDALSRADLDALTRPVTNRFELDWNERAARMLSPQVAYLRPGPFYDNRPEAASPWDPTDFHEFVDASFNRFIEAGATRLIIDLRNNPGGSNGFSDHLIAWFASKPFRFSDRFEIRVSEAAITSNAARLAAQSAGSDSFSTDLAAAYAEHDAGDIVDFPIAWMAPREGTRFEGDVYLLVNRHSYSNAVSVAAIGQDYGFATVMGQPTADLANTYGGMEHFTLPTTGIQVGFPKARILRPSRDERADTVIPDILIDIPQVTNADVMLEKALKIIQTD